MEKNKRNIYFVAALLFTAISVVEFYLINQNVINSKISVFSNLFQKKNTSRIEWKQITSEKAKISFNYPSVWPLAFEPDKEIEADNKYSDPNDSTDYSIIDSIDFNENWYRNAGGERYGFIIVMKQPGINTLDDYVKSIDIETEIYAKGVNVKIPRPKIQYSIIGGEVAITVYPQDNGARLDSPNDDLDFIVVKNGLIYRIAAINSDRFVQNKGLNTILFKEIVSSIRFIE